LTQLTDPNISFSILVDTKAEVVDHENEEGVSLKMSFFENKSHISKIRHLIFKASKGLNYEEILLEAHTSSR
jgi:hypothetical protein